MKAKDKIICSPHSSIISILKRLSKINDRSSILLIGPTGTGKELLADYIVENGPRSDKPFRKVNCSGLTNTLIDSQLFGHIKGAFTGAVRDREGLIMEAKGGTLFLDEIGNMPPPSQAKLLRALENGTFTKLGKDEEKTIPDVRFISATNKPEKMIIDLRERFQYQEEIQPLNERPSDIPYLLRSFMENAGFSAVDLPIKLLSR